MYPVGESEITVAPFEVPSHWPRCFGMDTGWNATAAVWLAHDKETQTVYVYSEYKRGQAEIAIHAEAIRARGAWIPGVADAAAITNQDGAQFIAQYKRLGLSIELPDKTVEAGIQDVWSLLSAGKLKVFTSCAQLLEEYRLYRRDDKGRVVKLNDHVMDALRYAVRSGLSKARMGPAKKGKPLEAEYRDPKTAGQSWMQ